MADYLDVVQRVQRRGVGHTCSRNHLKIVTKMSYFDTLISQTRTLWRSLQFYRPWESPQVWAFSADVCISCWSLSPGPERPNTPRRWAAQPCWCEAGSPSLMLKSEHTHTQVCELRENSTQLWNYNPYRALGRAHTAYFKEGEGPRVARQP